VGVVAFPAGAGATTVTATCEDQHGPPPYPMFEATLSTPTDEFGHAVVTVNGEGPYFVLYVIEDGVQT
jgi:hypothetical protein